MNISKKVFLILLIFVFQAGSLVGFGQIIFTKGYFVNNSGIKTECLIKNYDWRLNPVKVQYKLNDSADVLTSSIDSVKEFGIDDFCHYVRATVNIDRSPFDIKTLSTDRKPKWSKETVFLKELVCGKAGLWVYTEPEQFWFFYT